MRSCLLVLLAATVAACCPRSLPKTYPTLPGVKQVIEAVRGRRAPLHTLSGDAKVDTFTAQGRARAQEVLVVERGGRLRFETLSPFEQPISTLVSDGKTFALYDLGKRRFYHGPARPENISRLLPIRMRGRDIARILLGEAPIIPHDAARFEVDRCEGRYRLTFSQRRGPFRQILEVDARRLFPVRSRVFARDQLLYDVRFDRHEPLGKVLLPRKIRYLAPLDKVDLLVVYTDVSANEKFEDSTFRLQAPPGAEVVRLD